MHGKLELVNRESREKGKLVVREVGNHNNATDIKVFTPNGAIEYENMREVFDEWALLNENTQAYNRRGQKHSTLYKGVGKYATKGGYRYRAFISKNGEFRQKDFGTEWEAMLQRAKWAQELFPDVKSSCWELVANVALWGRDKKINNVDKQFEKIAEETAEIARCLVRGDYGSAELRDAIGDTLVTIIVLADLLGENPIDCLSEAYEVIKKRTGRTVAGSFVKDE